MLHVGLGRFRSVVHGVLMVPVSGVGVMRSFFVIASFMVLSGFLMVTRRVFVMFGCLVMMLGRLFRHDILLF